MSDWQHTMTDIIASTTYRRIRQPDGVEVQIVINIGKPTLITDDPELQGQGLYYAPVQIIGVYEEPELICIAGADAMQALCFAVTLPPTTLDALPYKDEIEMHVVPNWGFPRTVLQAEM